MTSNINLGSDYFAKESKTKLGITPKSSIIVCGFGAWNTDKKDIIDNFDAKEYLSKNDFWQHHFSLRKIIAEYPEHLRLEDEQ